MPCILRYRLRTGTRYVVAVGCEGVEARNREQADLPTAVEFLAFFADVKHRMLASRATHKDQSLAGRLETALVLPRKSTAATLKMLD